MEDPNHPFIQGLYAFLTEIGENPKREGLLKTPERVYESLKYMTRGLREDIDKIVKDGIFSEGGGELIVIRDIEFVSLCEHHMLPFFGHVHVGYIPRGKILGISKVARIVEHFSAMLQVQERMTNQIVQTLVRLLMPEFVGVVVKARHLCMIARGVKKQDAVIETIGFGGLRETEVAIQHVFLGMVQNK